MLATFQVINTLDDANPGSLRWAIGQVNADTADTVTNPDMIDFNIPTTDPGYNPSTGVWTIKPTTVLGTNPGLPQITNPVLIDGYFNHPGGAQPNTNSIDQRDNAKLTIELDGELAGSGAYGLNLQSGASGSTIRGLVINRFDQDEVILNCDGATIEGNFLGTDPSGTIAEPHVSAGLAGVRIFVGSSNLIGGTTPQARNLISGNTVEGIFVGNDGSAAAPGNNRVQGNFIGTDSTGTLSLGNGLSGITVFNSAGNTIGGPSSPAGNLISGNGGGSQPGISLSGTGTQNNVAQNNLIGTDVTGNAAISNSTGITINTGASNNTIGDAIGGPSGTGNTIAFNHLDGVNVDAAVSNLILSNSIYSNGNLAIELSHNGNNLQPAPILTSASSSGGTTTINGTLQAAPGTRYLIQFYSNAAGKPAGPGEGQTFLGQATPVVTDSTGFAVITATLPVAVAADRYLSATATNLARDDTSEFSEYRPNLSVIKSADPVPATQFSPLTYTVTVSNGGASPTTGITLTDTIPAGATFDSASGGATPVGNLLTFPVGTLNRGATATFKIVVIPNLTGTITNTASVTTSAAATNPDLDPSNDTTTLSVPVRSGFTVFTKADDGPGSLRQVIRNLDSATGTIPIDFQIPGLGPYIIQPKTALPAITHAATIDGLPPGSFNGTTPVIIDGSSIGTGPRSGQFPVNPAQVANEDRLLDIEAQNVVVRGLGLRGSAGFGIVLGAKSGHDTLVSNNIGTSPDGTNVGRPNAIGGVLVLSADNTIGGATPLEGNVIAGGSNGVVFNGAGATRNALISNFIGTDRAGNILGDPADKVDGIDLVGASGNTIGRPGQGNTIAGYQTGIYLFGGSANNTIQANTIRDNRVIPAGNPNVENGGVLLTDANDNTIGGMNADEGNTIAGNLRSGVVIFGGATRNTLGFNTIRNNGGTGVYLFNAPGNRVGLVGAPNTISNNHDSGVDIEGTKSSGNLVQANTIADNLEDGVFLFNAPNNTIGGATAGQGNTIRNNTFSGVHLEGNNATGDVVQGNTIIGAPQVYGVLLENGATRNTIGGTGDAANTFLGNGARDIQVLINGLPPSTADQSGGNTIAANNFSLPSGVMIMARGIGKHQVKLLVHTHADSKAGKHRHPAGPAHHFTKGVQHAARVKAAASKPAHPARHPH